MKASRHELMATPQFDSGRWKLRLQRIPISIDKQLSAPAMSNVAVGVTIISPLLCLFVAYLWARIVG